MFSPWMHYTTKEITGCQFSLNGGIKIALTIEGSLPLSKKKEY